MVSFGVRNTRMKDFFDLRFLAGRFAFDGATLHDAIRATFERRRTQLIATPYPLSDAFAAEPEKQTQWAAFLQRNALEKAQPSFAEVIRELRGFIGPALAGNPGECAQLADGRNDNCPLATLPLPTVGVRASMA